MALICNFDSDKLAINAPINVVNENKNLEAYDSKQTEVSDMGNFDVR